MTVPVITIDGPSASGKGTIAAMVASRLSFHYLDSGSLYRLVALYADQNRIAWDDEASLARAALCLPVEFRTGQVLLSNNDVSEAIRAERIGIGASRVGALPAVRSALLQRQREFRRLPGLVTDGRDMMENNYQYTLSLFNHCQNEAIPFLYASSAAVYGAGDTFVEQREHEGPLNVYGYSKFLFDQVLRQRIKEGLSAQVVGFRYFNVYGPREQHKARMASVAFHHFNQYRADNKVKLFGAWDGWDNGMQSRDFVSVEDVVKVNLFFLDHPEKSGIFNLGTGRAQPFNDVALSTVNACRRHDSAPTLPDAPTQVASEYNAAKMRPV